MSATDKQVRAALQGYVAAWRDNDKAAYLGLFAEGAQVIDPVGTPANEGLEAIENFWDRVHSLPMTYEPEVVRIVACGGEGMLHFVMKSHDGNGGGMAMDIVDVFAVDDAGKITQIKAYWDSRCMSML